MDNSDHSTSSNYTNNQPDKSKLIGSHMDSKNGGKVAGKTIGKADTRYWLQPKKLFSDPRGNGGLCCRIQVQGKREPFPLRTNNRATAAKKAAMIYGDVVALGWAAALAKHKQMAAKPSKGSTVGDIIKAVSELSNVRPATLRGYAGALRRIVAAIEDINPDKGRFASTGDGRSAWLAAVDSVPISKLTPDRIEAWKINYVQSRSGGNELKARTCRNSANTCLRQAKGLFAKRILRLIVNRIEIPSPLPFDGVDFYPRQSMRYDSKINAMELAALADKDLAVTDVEAYKAFILCLFAALRRNEADKLRWSSVDFNAGVIRVEAHDDFAPKAETSLDKIAIEPSICEILRKLRDREPEAEYVLASTIKKPKGHSKPTSQKTPTWSRYRANHSLDRLADWLRANGVNDKTPLHTLRKEAGSLVNMGDNIFTASRFLRHADISLTAMYYVDQKKRATVSLGSVPTKPSKTKAKQESKHVRKEVTH
jgi:integrase